MLGPASLSAGGGRLEDARLVQGAGQYSADLGLPGQLYGAFLRSPVAHADILQLDVGAALELPGVVAVLTGAELNELGFGKMGPVAQVPQPDGSLPVIPVWPPLAYGRMRYAGEPVALVVAESPAQAADALEAIVLEFEELPSSVATEFDPQPAVPIWAHAPDNVASLYHAGDRDAVQAAFADASHVVRQRLVNQRLIVNPMEPRSAVARYHQDEGLFEIYCASQGASVLATQIATMMNVPVERVRVISKDVGGGFGTRTHVYPEYPALLEASRRVGRPVKWTANRSEGFVSDTQGRDSIIEAEMALDADHKITAIRLNSVTNIGAYQSSHTAFIATVILFRCMVSVYRTQAIQVDAKCIYTNTVPVGPYRGAGRPEANLAVEALVDEAAHQLGVDRHVIREKNLITADLMPYVAPNGLTYDSGDFPRVLRQALKMAGYTKFEERRAESRRRGMLRGLGIACYLEIAGGTPYEDVHLEVDEQGIVWLDSGLHSNGQGHETVFCELLANRLGLPVDMIQLAASISTRVPQGAGSVGSRSMTVGGVAIATAATALVERAKSIGAQLLQCSSEDLTYEAGAVIRRNTGQSLRLGEIVALGNPLKVLSRGKAEPTFPNGCHVAEVEIDPETGVSRFVSYVAVDDVGRCFNSTLVSGQLHGGIAQGLGQVLMEVGHYDSSGQLLSGSFMDYAMPKADNLPAYQVEHLEIPARTNELGTKGAGEAGTTGAVAAGFNAIRDALRQAGVENFDMPATPDRIWQCIRQGTS